jgi:hypothetical protein
MGDYEEALRRVKQRQPQYLNDVSSVINRMMQGNQSQNQQDEQRLIDLYLKTYADRPDKIQEILKALELYQQNDWQSAQPTKRWY